MRGRILGAALLVLGIGAIGRAADGPWESADIDKHVVITVYETAKLGTDIFNKGRHEECFGLYQGSLIALQPLLDHRPKLAASVRDKLQKAKTLKAVEGSFMLREALDEIQKTIAPSKTEPKVEPKKLSLWDRLGGEKAMKAIVHDLIDEAVKDPKVNFDRGGKYKLDAKATARMEQLYVELISLLSGGPLEYSEKRNLKEAHAGMKITDAEFDAFLAVMQKVLEQHKVNKEDSAELMKHMAATRAVIVEVKGKGGM
jgi:hemoglobin